MKVIHQGYLTRLFTNIYQGLLPRLLTTTGRVVSFMAHTLNNIGALPLSSTRVDWVRYSFKSRCKRRKKKEENKLVKSMWYSSRLQEVIHYLFWVLFFVVFLTDVLDFLIDYWFNRLQTDLGSRSLYDRLVLRLYEGAIDFITWLIVAWFHRLNDIDRLSVFDEGLGVWRVLDVGLLIDYWLMGCLWELLIWSNDGLIMEGSQIQLL